MKGKKLTQKKRAKKMKGGNSENIAHTLLLNSIIPYLPTTETVKSESNVRDYLSATDALTLLEIVGSDEKYTNSKSLNFLIDSIDRNTLEMIKTMGESLKIPQLRKDVETFEIDCLKLAKKTNVKDLLELPNYLLDCNDELCNRNMNWYDIIMGFRKLDDDYEELVRKEIVQKKIIINTNKTLTARERLRRNNKVREIMKRRLLKCCRDPRSFFSKIKGTVAWIDYNQCTSCPTDDCILYIDDNYKSFLTMNLGMSSVKKLKILIFIEIRIHLLAKYIFIESLRINSQRKRKVAKLVEKIYRNDVKNGRISKVNTKIIGGSNDFSPSLLPMGSPLKPAAASPVAGSPGAGSPGAASPGAAPPGAGSPGAGSPGAASPGAAPPAMGLSLKSEPPASPLFNSPGGSYPFKETSPSPKSSILTTPPPSQPPATPPSKSPVMKVSEDDDEDEEFVVYLTYNRMKDVQNMNTLKRLIIEAIKRITHMNSAENIMIGNPDGSDKGYRSGDCTYSIEVTISKSEDPDETFKNMKKYIIDSILDGSLVTLLNVMEGTLSLRDIFFNGIEKGIVNKTRMRYKRCIAEVKAKYPTGGQEEKKIFATQIKDSIHKALRPIFNDKEEQGQKRRIEIELISAYDNDDTVILAQFVIMDSYDKKEDSYDIAKTLSATTINDETKKYITNEEVVDINMIDRCYTFDTESPCNASKKKLASSEVKGIGLQKDHIVVINNNCQDVVKNLRENYVSNAPLSANCEDVINKELGITR